MYVLSTGLPLIHHRLYLLCQFTLWSKTDAQVSVWTIRMVEVIDKMPAACCV